MCGPLTGEVYELMSRNHKEDRRNLIGYIISDAREHGGIKENWNFILGDFVLAIAAGR
jgi:hypothetical protein